MGKKIGIALGALVVVAAVAAVVILGQLGRLIERGVETAGPRITGTDVTLGGASVSIFDGTGSLRRLHIGNPQGFESEQAFDLGEIAIAVDVKSVTADVVRIRSIVIDGPRLVAEFDAAGRSNLDAIMNHVKAASRGKSGGGGEQAGGDPEPKLIIEEFRFQNAEVRALAPAYGVDKGLKIKPVVLKNLGGKGGASAADLANQVMRPIVDAALRAAMQEYLAAQRGKLEEKAKEKLFDKVFK